MSGFLLLLTGLVAGFLAGRRLWRGRSGQGSPLIHAATPLLVPDPALAWLRRAVRARGVWAIEQRAGAGGTRTYQSLDPGWVASEPELDLVERRLAAIAAKDGEGAERLESGLLLTVAAAGSVVAALLTPDAGPEQRATTRSDLAALLDGIGRRPVLHDLAQVREGQAVETVESVGLRLAYQLERIAGAEAYVTAREGDAVRIIGVSGLADRRALGLLLPGDAPLAAVARGGAAGSSDDPLGRSGKDRRRQPPARVEPLVSSDRTVGAVAWRVPEGGTVSAEVIREVAEALRAGAARLESAIGFARVLNQATRDPLTGLLNRRGFDERMGQVGPERGTLIALDIDRFKLLNDTLGHVAGDGALVHLARLLTEQVRGQDAVGRVGGEEFLVWLPGTTLEEGARIAERIRVRLGGTRWDWRGRSWPLSASFGVAGWPETTRSKDNLATQADAALYAAKRGGRDRVVIWRADLGASTG